MYNVNNNYYTNMRTIITISLPTQVAKNLKKTALNENYSGVSDFVRDLYSSWEADQQLVNDLAVSKKEISQGKAVRIKSASDLLK